MSYTTILHDKRKELGISIQEYVLADMVYRLSVNPKNQFQGWCWASRQFFADEMGISRRTVVTIINNLIEAGLLIRNDESQYLQVTDKWVTKIEQGSKVFAQGVQNLHGGCAEIAQDGRAEIAHNSNIIDNNKDNIYNKAYILKHKDEIVEQAKQMYKDKNVDKAMADFIDYITINKKKWSNFKLAFFRWVREDQYNQYAIKQPNYKRLN